MLRTEYSRMTKQIPVDNTEERRPARKPRNRWDNKVQKAVKSPKCSMSNTGAVAKHTSDMLRKTEEVMATKWAKEL